MNTTPTTEERIWAVLAHLSALAFGMGIALPVVGWSDQRRKSKYASFQCLQALGYQSLGYTIWILSFLVVVIAGSIILLWAFQPGSGSAMQDTALRPAITIFLVVLSGLFAIYFILPIIASVACILGRDFRYPILGDRLARYLEYQPDPGREEQIWLDEDRELRWVAAMGHFSILILLWGMLTPLTAWILQGRRSPFLRLQSMQTLLYQAGATVLFFIAFFAYFFGLILVILGIQTIGTQSFDSPLGISGIAVFGVVLLISILLLLLVPLLHILGQWAGYRVLKGDDYRYPLIGRLVERWMAKPGLRETDSLNLQGKSS